MCAEMNTASLRAMLLFLLCIWSVGLGFRFVAEYFYFSHDNYVFGMFDALFDWSVLFVLGLVNLIIILYDNYRRRKAS